MPLTPSQRIKILKDVSQRLAEDEWPLIDLTLTQFKLPTKTTWSGDKTAYVLEMAKNASDETLNGLAEHSVFRLRCPGRPPFPTPHSGRKAR